MVPGLQHLLPLPKWSKCWARLSSLCRSFPPCHRTQQFVSLPTEKFAKGFADEKGPHFVQGLPGHFEVWFKLYILVAHWFFQAHGTSPGYLTSVFVIKPDENEIDNDDNPNYYYGQKMSSPTKRSLHTRNRNQSTLPTLQLLQFLEPLPFIMTQGLERLETSRQHLHTISSNLCTDFRKPLQKKLKSPHWSDTQLCTNASHAAPSTQRCLVQLADKQLASHCVSSRQYRRSKRRALSGEQVISWH